MIDKALSSVRQRLERAIEEADNREVRYELRTASQLLDAVHHHNQSLTEALDNADLDDELK